MKCPGRRFARRNEGALLSGAPTKQDICTNIHRAELRKSHIYAWFCIGGILFVVCLCFLAMSFKFNVAGKQNFAPKSMEFIVCCLTGAASFLFLLFATVGLILTNRDVRKWKAELAKHQS